MSRQTPGMSRLNLSTQNRGPPRNGLLILQRAIQNAILEKSSIELGVILQKVEEPEISCQKLIEFKNSRAKD